MAGEMDYRTPDQKHFDAVGQHFWQNVMPALAVGGTALGVGGRSIYGLLQSLARRRSKPRVPRDSVAIDIPIPVAEKQALSFGDYGNVPYAYPAAIAAGAGTAVGGWKLMDYLLEKQRKSKVKSDLARAKQDYNQALLDEMAHAPKTAAERTAAALTRVCKTVNTKFAAEVDRFPQVKQASVDLGTQLGNWYLAYAALAAPAVAAATYSAAKKRNESNVLEKARKLRMRQDFERNPPPVFAKPVPVKGLQDVPEEPIQ